MAYLHMVRFILSLIFRLIVTIQSLLNLGIAETAVYLRAVVEYRDFQIPAKNDSYFLHLEMLILTACGFPNPQEQNRLFDFRADTSVCSYINTTRGLAEIRRN